MQFKTNKAKQFKLFQQKTLTLKHENQQKINKLS